MRSCVNPEEIFSMMFGMNGLSGLKDINIGDLDEEIMFPGAALGYLQVCILP